MILAGALDFFQGLIAIVRDDYYTFTPNQVIVVDLTTWGWISCLGSAVALTGMALWLSSGSGDSSSLRSTSSCTR